MPTCVAIPESSLDWHLHGGHDYYVSLRIEGLSGLSRIVTSDVYSHYSGPPSVGIVYEVSLNSPEVHGIHSLCPDNSSSLILIFFNQDLFKALIRTITIGYVDQNVFCVDNIIFWRFHQIHFHCHYIVF